MVNRVLSHLQLELGLERGILSLKVSLGSTFYRLSDRMGTGRTFQYANSECVVNQDCTWTHIAGYYYLARVPFSPLIVIQV